MIPAGSATGYHTYSVKELVSIIEVSRLKCYHWLTAKDCPLIILDIVGRGSFLGTAIVIL